MLLQNKNSAILRAETAIIRIENLWSLQVFAEIRLRLMKNLLTLLIMSENHWASMEFAGHLSQI